MDPSKCEGRRDMSGGRKGNSDGGDDHGSSVGGGGGGNNNNNNGTEGGNKSSSQMLGLLDEFTKIYSDRLQRVEQASMKTDNACYLQNKVCVLEAWVRDLGEQNAVLVATVEELEREAGERVALLEDRLTKMATTTRDSCLSLRDHQIQVSSLVADKMGLEKEAHELGEKVVGLERKTLSLKEENNNLQNDLNNLVQVITRARLTGQWEADNLTFSCVTPEQVFGPVLSSSRRSSQSLKESQHDYIQHMLEEHLRKDSSSLRSSLSNLQDGDSSMYGGRGSEKEMVIMKLRSDLRSLQSAQDETNQQLLERDKQIADLQMQLTELHHELALSQAEVNSVNHTLQEVRHRSRHETVEITRKEEVVRQLLSKQTKKDSVRGSYTSLCDLDSVITGDNNVESQLSENIDILAGRLAELEEECTQLREAHTALKDTHALCAPTISMLQDQLARSHQNQVELRTVLTAEVAERHDQLVALRDKLKEEEQRHHETKMQLQLKTEVVKDLRKEVRECKERPLANIGKEVNHMDKGTREGPAVNGFCSQSSQVSKLENELAEKSVLLRELQSHLAASRQELHLKDETLSKLEKKLDSVRREGGHNGERMQYLTGQLTSLQLEVGRTHGQAEHLRRQVEKKSELIQKMEAENTSLSQQLNDKSLTLERFQSEVLKMSTELEKKKKEIGEQRLTISSLQEALVTSKRTCDDLRSRLDNDVSAAMLHHSLPPQIFASSNNPNSIPSVTNKSILADREDPHYPVVLPSACVDQNGIGLPVNSSRSFPITASNSMTSILQPDSWQPHASQPHCKQVASTDSNTVMMPDVSPSDSCAKEVISQSTPSAITPDVLSSCGGTPLLIRNSQNEGNKVLNGDSPSAVKTFIGENTENSISSQSVRTYATPVGQTAGHSGRVYDV